MKPLKDEEAADEFHEQSQNAVYQTCATLAGGEALAAYADPTVLQQMSDERLRDIRLRREDVGDGYVRRG